jgi:hypothetical protein
MSRAQLAGCTSQENRYPSMPPHPWIAGIADGGAAETQS